MGVTALGLRAERQGNSFSDVQDGALQTVISRTQNDIRSIDYSDEQIERLTDWEWKDVGAKVVCDVSAGEVYLQSSPGKVSALDECKKLCEDAASCQSITFFKSGWCSHFASECTKTKRNPKAVQALSYVVDC